MSEAPAPRPGAWVWRGGAGRASVVFTGKGNASTAGASLEELEPQLELGKGRHLAYLRQIHSATVLPAAPGCCGDGDALWTRRTDLALAVVTADCVPLLLATDGAVAAVHAGWRGIVAGVVPAAVASLAVASGEARAWIGPAIGPCCYEVGDEVAEKVAAASSPAVVRRSPGSPRPHLDLPAAVAWQLAAAGVQSLERVSLCTKCAGGELWSYRREGAGAGRNRAFIWMREEGASPTAASPQDALG